MNYSLHTWFVFLALAGAAVADEVQLKNGSKLEGTVLEDGNKVMVDVGSGTVTLDRSEVKSIRRPDDQIQEYDRRVQALKPDDPNGYYQTYLWARQLPGMKTRAESLLKKALEADPNFEPAHRAMGKVNFKGAWLSQDEYKAALGLVRYQGEWVSAEAAERLKRIDQELMLAAGKRAAEDQRQRDQLTLERERIAQRQRFIDMVATGGLPTDISSALGYPVPWGMRYWGPAQPVVPQPNAD
ncbi:MAG TPA: hypothetical protein VNM14_01645 [Planctomycetota bacterium]|jgi:hypothetical protein|nr:hypothetical protein [Planctomycetota bacterium]